MRIVRTRVTPRHAAAAVAAATIVAAGLALPAGLTAQLGAGVARTARLEVSTGSEAARTQFWSALDDFTSAYNFRASERMRAVVALDSTFGLARAFYAFGTGTLPRPEREAQLNRAVRDAATGSIGELLMARALQEQFKENPVNARALLGTAVELMPADPYVAHMYAVATGPRVEGVRELKEVVTRFPDYAPAYRDLAIAYWRVGDRAAPRPRARHRDHRGARSRKVHADQCAPRRVTEAGQAHRRRGGRSVQPDLGWRRAR